MVPSDQTRLGTLVSEITNLHSAVEELGNLIREKIAETKKSEVNSELAPSGSYWTSVAYMDAITRIRLILEQNFHFIETMSVLSVTRYLFELLVWLRTLRQDSRFGLVYRFQIIEKQISYYQDYIAEIEREITIMKTLGDEEDRETQKFSENVAKRRFADLNKNLGVNRPAQPSAESLRLIREETAESFRLIREETDRKARRSFCIYAQQAKTNGYPYQARLLETKKLPELRELLNKCKSSLSRALAEVKETPPLGKWEKQEQLWNWKEQATKSGMGDQYGFIYSYTSRLLHATPASLTTEQKLLEPDEMIVFLEYIYVSILDAIELARDLFGISPKHH